MQYQLMVLWQLWLFYNCTSLVGRILPMRSYNFVIIALRILIEIFQNSVTITTSRCKMSNNKHLDVFLTLNQNIEHIFSISLRNGLPISFCMYN